MIQHHVLGLSFKEIAARAGIAETAAKLRSSRGMAQLRALLKGPRPQMTSVPADCERGFAPTIRQFGRCRRHWCERSGARRSPRSRCWPRQHFSTCARTPHNLAGSAAGVHHSCKWRSGFALIAAALRESVPGRSWRAGAIGLWIVTPIVLAIAVTLASWEASPVTLQRAWWMVWVLCLSGSAATALPLVALASVLVARAYPTRPGIAGVLAGSGRRSDRGRGLADVLPFQRARARVVGAPWRRGSGGGVGVVAGDQVRKTLSINQ